MSHSNDPVLELVRDMSGLQVDDISRNSSSQNGMDSFLESRTSENSIPNSPDSGSVNPFPQCLPPSQTDLLLARVGYNEDNSFHTISLASSRPIEDSSQSGPFYVPPEQSLTNAVEGDQLQTTVLNYHAQELLACLQPSMFLMDHRKNIISLLQDVQHHTSQTQFQNEVDIHVLFDVSSEETLKQYTDHSTIDILVRVCPREVAEEEVTSTLKLQSVASLHAYTKDRPLIFDWVAYNALIHHWAENRPHTQPTVTPEVFLYTLAKNLKTKLYLDPVCTVRHSASSSVHLRVSPGKVHNISSPPISIQIVPFPHIKDRKPITPPLKFLHLQPLSSRVMNSVLTMAPFLQPILLILYKHLCLYKLDDVYTGGISVYYQFLLLLRYTCLLQDATGAICRHAVTAIFDISYNSIQKPNLSKRKHIATSSYLCDEHGNTMYHPSQSIDLGQILIGFLYHYVYGSSYTTNNPANNNNNNNNIKKKLLIEDSQACVQSCYISKLRCELPDIYVCTPYIPKLGKKSVNISTLTATFPNQLQLCIKDPITQGNMGQKSFKMNHVLEAWTDLYRLLLLDCMKIVDCSKIKVSDMSAHDMLLFLTGKQNQENAYIFVNCCKAHHISAVLGPTAFDNRLPVISQNIPKYPSLHKTSPLSSSTLFSLFHQKHAPQPFLGHSRARTSLLLSHEYYPIEPQLLHAPAQCSCSLCLGITESPYLATIQEHMKQSKQQLHLLRDPRVGMPMYLPCPIASYPLQTLTEHPSAPLIFFPYQLSAKQILPMVILPVTHANYKRPIQPVYRKHTCTSVVMILTVILHPQHNASHVEPTNLPYIFKNDKAAYIYSTVYVPISINGDAQEQLPLLDILPGCVCGGLFLKVYKDHTSHNNITTSMSNLQEVSHVSTTDTLSIPTMRSYASDASQNSNHSTYSTESTTSTYYNDCISVSGSGDHTSNGDIAPLYSHSNGSSMPSMNNASVSSVAVSYASMIHTKYDLCEKIIPLLANLYHNTYLQEQMSDIIIAAPLQATTETPHVCDLECRNVQNRLLDAILTLNTGLSTSPNRNQRYENNKSYRKQYTANNNTSNTGNHSMQQHRHRKTHHNRNNSVGTQSTTDSSISNTSTASTYNSSSSNMNNHTNVRKNTRHSYTNLEQNTSSSTNNVHNTHVRTPSNHSRTHNSSSRSPSHNFRNSPKTPPIISTPALLNNTSLPLLHPKHTAPSSRRFLSVNSSKPRHTRERALSEDGNTTHTRWMLSSMHTDDITIATNSNDQSSNHNDTAEKENSNTNTPQNSNDEKKNGSEDTSTVLTIHIPPEFYYKE